MARFIRKEPEALDFNEEIYRLIKDGSHTFYEIVENPLNGDTYAVTINISKKTNVTAKYEVVP